MKLNNSNSQQALWVAMGSLASFGVTIVTSMILSRYFNKEDYGTYKQVMYIYNTLLTIFTLGLPQAFGYFLPRVPKEQGRDVINKITSIFFLTGSIFSLVLFFGSPIIANILQNDKLIDAVRLFSPVPFFLLPTLGIESIYSTYRKTYISSIYAVLTRIFIIICVVVPVIALKGTYKTAILGFMLSSAISFCIALYLKNAPFRNLDQQKSDITRKSILKFSMPLMYAGLWGVVIHSADQFFVSRYFGTRTFAEFSNGSMELPFVGMIIGACTTVLYPLFSKMNSEHLDPLSSIFPIWKSVFKKTALLIYPMVAFCWVYSFEIMSVLYGEQYLVSGIYFRIKLFANLFTLIAYAPVILSIGKTKYYANVHMYSAIILVLLEFAVVKLIPDAHYVTVVSVFCHIGRIFAMLFLIAAYFKISIVKLFPISLIVKIMMPSVVVLFLIKVFITSNMNSLMACVIGGSIYVVIYLIYAYLMKIDYLSLVKPILKK